MEVGKMKDLKKRKVIKMHCDQCSAAMIQGMFCHEQGCPNSRKTWVADRQEWVRFVECRECGCEVESEVGCDCAWVGAF
jgi:hypothetical protein